VRLHRQEVLEEQKKKALTVTRFGEIGAVPIPELEPIPEGDRRTFADTTECSFRLCNAKPVKANVGGVPASTYPYVYIIVPFRNRLDNLARLISSINNATTPQQRACTCIVISDFRTSANAIPTWKNASCIATMHAAHKIYYDSSEGQRLWLEEADLAKVQAQLVAHRQRRAEEAPLEAPSVPAKASLAAVASVAAEALVAADAEAPAQAGTEEGVAAAAEPPPDFNVFDGDWSPAAGPCPSGPLTFATSHSVLREGPAPAVAPSSAPNTMKSLMRARLNFLPGFNTPLHVDISGLSGHLALRHVLSLYDGPSKLLDAWEYVGDAAVKFSRAGGIQAGIDSITTHPGQSLVFVCDADMILRPGFFQDFLRHPVSGSAVYYPVCWSTCWGKGLETSPRSSAATDDGNGIWRIYGFGMLVAYVNDLRGVGGMSDVAFRGRWGGEDNRLFDKLRERFKVVRRKCPYLIHAYHSQVKDWSASEDGMHGSNIGPFGRNVCSPLMTCPCPNGTAANDVARILQTAFHIPASVEIVNKDVDVPHGKKAKRRWG
jgi:hypothetical protein